MTAQEQEKWLSEFRQVIGTTPAQTAAEVRRVEERMISLFERLAKEVREAAVKTAGETAWSMVYDANISSLFEELWPSPEEFCAAVRTSANE